MPRLPISTFAAALTLASCAPAYESRLRTSLMDAGLSERMAGCMAERMVDRLSTAQLRSLSRLGWLKDRDIGEMRVDEFLRRLESAVDPAVYAAITRAGLGCATAG